MPAVVRGGRRQNSGPTPSRSASAPNRGRGRSQNPRNATGVPGKVAAFGRLDLTPGWAVAAVAAGVVVLAGVLATGSRAERIGQSVTNTVGSATAAMGLKVDHLYLKGQSPEATREIHQAVAVAQGQPITTVDLEAVRKRVEAVGWVKSARVVRLLPNTLMVSVVEHDRLAVWQTGGHAWVIDGQGHVIPRADPGRYPRLPLVVGKGADQAAAEVLPLLAQRPGLMNRIDALVRVDERRWDLRLKDGGLIQLPALGEEAALIQLDALDQRERLLELGFARIDLRTPDQVAVRPRGAA